jgi:hypothetical protein
MKFSASVILAIIALSCVHAENGLRNRLVSSDTAQRKLGKKDGKKDCITDDAIVIDRCDYIITTPGRYILEDDLKCMAEQNGIIVGGPVQDVYIDCQDNSIIGDKATTSPTTAILIVFGVTDVTIANCKGRFFRDGLLAIAGWTGLTITGSTFKYNTENGMELFGNTIPMEPKSILTVIDSKFSENGSKGINSEDVDGTFISTVANKNLDTGIRIREDAFVTINTFVDVTTNDNGDGGIVSNTGMDVNVIGSTACNNQLVDPNAYDDLDLDITATAHANTCDSSFPEEILGIPICECSCKGGSSPSLEAMAAVGDAAVSNSTVAVSNNTIPTKDKDKEEKDNREEHLAKFIAVPP